MANIQTLLNNIKTAVYGKDVRQSIHDSIKQCYYDGKAGAIDLDARERAAEAEAMIAGFMTLPPGTTAGNGELMGIRYGLGGKVYPSAGEAVREQIRATHTIEVTEKQPSKENTQMWINPKENEEFCLPEIRDELVNYEDTWSSEKLSIMFKESMQDRIGLSFKKRSYSEFGHWIDSTSRYCSDSIRSSILNVGDVIHCNADGYLIFVRVFDTNDMVVIPEASSTNFSKSFIITEKQLVEGYTLYVYVCDESDDTTIADGLEGLLSSNIYIEKNYKRKIFIHPNFDDSKLIQGSKYAYICDNISDTDFHKWYAYYPTDKGKIIDTISTRFYMPAVTNYPRFFIEDECGNMVFFSTTSALVNNTRRELRLDAYYLDRTASSYRAISVTTVVLGTIESGTHVDIKIRVLNGVCAFYRDDVYCGYIDISDYFEYPVRCGINIRGNVDATSYCEDFSVSYRTPTVTHISFDDQISVLQDLNTNPGGKYSSIFDHEFFNSLKELHDEYGCVFTLYLFNQNSATGGTGFKLSDMTDEYANEFKLNAHWLKFGFHSAYTDTYCSELADDKVIADIKEVYSQINRFAGYKSADRVIRFGYFSANKSVINSAIKSGLLNGIYTADDSRGVNVGLTEKESALVSAAGEYYDIENDVMYYRTLHRFDSEGTLSELKYFNKYPCQHNVIFAHNLSENNKTRLVNCLDYLKTIENRYCFIF